MGFIFRKCADEDFPELKKLWLKAFDDSPEAVDLFFERNKSSFAPYCAAEKEKIVSALFLLPCSLNGKQAHYMCGVATAPEYRRRGIMSGLIDFSLDQARKNGDLYSLLFPANQNESLYNFYGRLGYRANCSAGITEMTRSKLLSHAKSESGKPDYENLQILCFDNNFLFWNNNLVDFAAEYYRLYNIKFVSNQTAFALVEEAGGIADVFYSAYSDFGSLGGLLLENTKAERFSFTLKSDDPLLNGAEPQRYGMIKALDKSAKTPNNIFIGITLN